MREQASPNVRRRFVVSGQVRGVGFRYHALRLAERLKLNGFVANSGRGVSVEVEGSPETIEAFRRALFEESPPPYAVVGRIVVSDLPPTGARGFRIAPDILG